MSAWINLDNGTGFEVTDDLDLSEVVDRLSKSLSFKGFLWDNNEPGALCESIINRSHVVSVHQIVRDES